MNPTPMWRVVAEREMVTRLRDKTFLGATAFSLALLVIVFAVVAFLDGRTKTYDVAVVSPVAASAVSDAGRALRAEGADATLRIHREADGGAAERSVRRDDVDAALLPTSGGLSVVGHEKLDDELEQALRAGVADAVQTRNAASQGVDLSALQAGTVAKVRLLDPGPEDAAARSAVAFGFALVFLFTALAFGMTIAQSVVQEKESRIVEILAAAVPIRALLWGKVLGNTLLALGQVVLIGVVGVVGLALTGRGALLSGVGPAVAWYVALFALGFVSLASLWSVAGSMAGRQEDLQSTTLPGQALLFLPYFVSVLGSEQVRTVCSMLPIVSTMTMPGRIAEGHVPWWQIAVALVTTLLAAVALIRLGERLYERSLLHTQGRLSYRELFRTPA